METPKKEQDAGVAQNGPIDYTKDPSGVHIKNRSVGAKQMNESYSKPEPGKHEGDTAKYANTTTMTTTAVRVK